MTEAEWLACEDVNAMLETVSGTASARKARLFAAHCCRRIWRLLEDDDVRNAVEVAEIFADGLIEDAERHSAAGVRYRGLIPGENYEATLAAGYANDLNPLVAARRAASLGRIAVAVEAGEYIGDFGERTDGCDAILTAESRPQCAALREIAGDPFRPSSLPIACRTPMALALAQVAYGERSLPEGHLDNARLGVLSDALEEPGCADEALLSHLRSPGPHVRGCWALDLVLGKK
jgi:hypothetical protein